jgi:hypothetical protein
MAHHASLGADVRQDEEFVVHRVPLARRNRLDERLQYRGSPHGIPATSTSFPAAISGLAAKNPRRNILSREDKIAIKVPLTMC